MPSGPVLNGLSVRVSGELRAASCSGVWRFVGIGINRGHLWLPGASTVRLYQIVAARVVAGMCPIRVRADTGFGGANCCNFLLSRDLYQWTGELGDVLPFWGGHAVRDCQIGGYGEKRAWGGGGGTGHGHR